VNDPKSLSPAAQAVFAAFTRGNTNLIEDFVYRSVCADALRAVADQVVPDRPRPSADSDYHLMQWSKSLDQYAQRQQTRAEILAIADELLWRNRG
jgi:hypothetical protein